MAKTKKTKPVTSDRFNIMMVGQGGRLQYEALIAVASLRHTNPDFKGRVIIAEPQKNHRWDSNPAINNAEVRAALEALGAEIVPFENEVFGCGYPYGNKIEGLKALPEGEPFLFLDTDTLITGDLSRVPFDFARPTASMKRENTWPSQELYGPTYSQIWSSLYDKFGLDFDSSQDKSQPEEYWRRYLYFNAGFFYYQCPKKFGDRFLEYARAIRDEPPEELVCQEMRPWLDQVALPLVIHSLGGGRVPEVSDLMDHDVTCHYRVLPLLYARERDAVVEILEEVCAPNKLKKVLKQYEPIRRMIYQNKGEKARAMFDRENLPRREQALRNQLKRAKLWLR
ncbi:hypothetical protein C8N43_2920 [Litoreibacter ponti]|uniref:Uncharacterized protein n=1 Tax=Litoreibacter ponti TaxID=1510457 RepID=A0A2T6BDK9_9RHOB|nr:hypothetical protein [Litoreibacter ponti]PTX54114.1 hypothetical protein C8N43_2920 [Litoreibacter ponti]